MCTTGLSKLSNVQSKKFLREDNPFAEFYGLTLNEAKELQQRFSIPQDLFNKALEYYNGYNCNKQKIISIWSFLSFIQNFLNPTVPNNTAIQSYWKNTSICEGLNTSALKSSIIKSWVMKLLSEVDNSVNIRLYDKLRVEQIVNLREQCEKSKDDTGDKDPTLLFNFWLEQGYLTVSGNSISNFASIIIPNLEIKQEFEESLESYCMDIEGFDLHLAKIQAALWDRINFDVKTTDYLKDICKNANKIFKGVSVLKFNEAVFHNLMFAILYPTKYKPSSQVNCAKFLNQCKIDILLVDTKNKNVIIIELKYGETSLVALKQILEKKYCDVFENNTDYIVDTKNYLLIGMNMCPEKKITMSFLLNSQNIVDKIEICD